MIIQNIGTRALSMYIGSEELNELGFSPDDIGQQEANQLLKKALDDSSIKKWAAAEMEVYPGKDSLLLFVRRKSTKPFYFVFSDIEPLISACQMCKPLPSSLNYIGNKYLLTVFPLEGDSPPAIFAEFGEQIQISICQAIHYEEQGKFILSQQAIGKIKEYFN